MIGVRRFAVLGLVLLCAVVGAGPAGAAADSVTVNTQTPTARLPLAPGLPVNLSFTLNVTLASAPTADLLVVGYAEGKGDPIPLTSVVPVTLGSHIGVTGAITVTGSYTPPVTGVRWLAVQAVLGPLTQPVGKTPLLPFLVMSSTAGGRSMVYYTPGVKPELAEGYAAGYDASWQKVGETLDSFNDKTYNIFLVNDPDVMEQTMIGPLGWPQDLAAAGKGWAGGANSARFNGMVVHVGRVGVTGLSVTIIGHEYAENRFIAVYGGNQAAGWFWDGMADLLGMASAEPQPESRCDVEGLRMVRWRTALKAIRDGYYLPLQSIETSEQWHGNFTDSTRNAAQYAEGYTAVEYWQRQFGLSSLAKAVKQQPKTIGNLGATVQAAAGVSMERFEQDYLAAMRGKIGQPPPSIDLTVHVDAAGVTSQTWIYFNTYYGPGGKGAGFSTQSGLAAGDYSFQIAPDGTVTSADAKTKLRPFEVPVDTAQEGNIYVGINHPAYKGTAGTDGREQLSMIAIHGRAGLRARYFIGTDPPKTARIAGLPEAAAEDEEFEPISPDAFASEMPAAAIVEGPSGDCLGPWPDGNRIVATINAPRGPVPDLAGPANGATLVAMGADLNWTLPPGSTQYQLQVLPANNDGPAINLIRNADTSFKIQPPVLGQGPYVMLPGMTYTWRVRATSFNGPIDENSAQWGEWATKSFKTPAPTSAGLTPVQPSAGATVATGAPATLQWEHPDKGLFYWEIEVSGDTRFDMNPATATTFVWFNLVHGGVGAVPNAWQSPALTAGTTYYWRVRPRVQGDGTPVEWGPVWRFMAR